MRRRGWRLALHVFHRSDDDRATHDHPWHSLSIALAGQGWDEREGCESGQGLHVRAGMTLYRSPRYAHWIIVPKGEELTTLFLTGPKVREWGFLCPSGWKHWQDFTRPTEEGGASGGVGAGCGEFEEIAR